MAWALGRRRRILLGLAAAFLLVLFAGCTKKGSPEQRLRLQLQRGEQAAETRDLRELRTLISERYADEHGNDRRALENLLRLYFLRHQNINLYTRVSELQLPSPERAQLVLYAAMTAQPAADADEVARRQADIFRFELVFADENGEWRLVGAAWRRAEPTDLLVD